MKLFNEKWFVVACDANFLITNIISAKNIEIDIKVNDQLSKIVSHDNLSKFLDFTLSLKIEKALFGVELCINYANNSLCVMDFGGVECFGSYIITASSNYLGLYEELIKSNNEQLNLLREKMKYSYGSLGNYRKVTELNNEIINIQRELSKKNAYILDLLKKKEEMNKELEVLNATKDRIFSIIGHDLRAPLANIIESINLISNDKFTYEELVQEDFFSALSDSVASTMLLLENLLEWSKSQMGELTFSPKDFALQKSIEPAVNLLKGVAAKKNISIVEEMGCNPYVYADQRMIEVVVRNLLSNAIKFTKEGGQVSIRATVENQFVKVFITDNGIGMPEEKAAAIFDLKNSNMMFGTSGEKGTGFGLVLCKNLIEQNGGSISVSSQVGKGSEFTITIPLSK